MYKDYAEKEYAVPILRNMEEAGKFLKIQNCFFKVITDI
jgi:hypothetical protein